MNSLVNIRLDVKDTKGSSRFGADVSKGVDKDFIIPNDRIEGMGLNLKYNLSGEISEEDKFFLQKIADEATSMYFYKVLN